ncbi:MAG: WhiB family transcriptional regulator [Actinomycetota bacterium]|nr:WhiB family transcriptional regulator [Actinomycetota bacterium]
MADDADARALPSLADLLRRPAWMAEGLCRDRPDVTWFPEKGQTAAPAKAVCAACPTRARCLEYAIETGVEGIWGGTSTRERRTLALGA